jgi:hypothetical protein
MAAKPVFKLLLCRQIMWEIYEDSCYFFAHHLHPDNFQPGMATPFPISLLEDIMRDVCYQCSVLRSTFPLAWQELPSSTPPILPMPKGPSPFGAAHFSSTGNGAALPNNLTQDSLAHIYSMIRAAFQDYHQELSSQVMIQHLLQHAKISLWDQLFLMPLIDQQTG